MRTALSAGRQGRGPLVLIRGAAGVGKSTLLGVAEREAHEAGWQVLAARGDDLERGFPFGGAIQLFAEPVRARMDQDPELLAGAAGLARPLLERAASPPSPGDADPGFPLLHGLHWLAVNLSERAPLLLSLDDVHWVDVPTLRFLLYLQQRAEGLALAILLTRRSGEPREPEAEALLARLEAAAVPLELAALGPDSVHELVRRRLPEVDAAFADACYEASGGNPFLLGELLGAAVREQVVDAASVRALRPASIRHAVLDRLALLGDAARKLAEAVALLGLARLELAAELADLAPDAAAAAADRLAEASVLAVGARLGFAHALLRDAVYEAIPPATRRRRHAAAARLLHERGADPAAVASHLSLCDPVGEPWVVAALREASRTALGRGAVPTALAHLRRALAEPGSEDDPGILYELGLAERAVGDPAWEEHLGAAVATLPDPQVRVTALAALSYGRWVHGDSPGAIQAAQTALAEIPPGSCGVAEAELLLSFVMAARWAPGSVDAAQQQLAISRLADGGALTTAEAARRALCAVDAVLEGRPAEAAALVASALECKDRNAAIWAEPQPILQMVAPLALGFLGRYREALEILEPVLALARRTGNRLLLGAALEASVAARAGAGDIAGGLADAQIGLELAESWELAASVTRGLYAVLLLESGQRQAASEAIRLPDGVEPPVGHAAHVFLPGSRAELALGLGHWEEALEQALLCGERCKAIRAWSPDFRSWRSLAARAAYGLDQRERALALAGEELDLARKIGSARATGVALTTLGSIQGGAAGREALREAVEILDATEAGLHQARARLALGMLLRRQGQRREAREVLAETLRRSRAMGASAMAESALAELGVAGGRPRRLEPAGTERLTPSQLRVAELAAAGHTNKEIAQALFVTLRTVETHLTEAYRRLGIGSREQLAEALRAAGARPERLALGPPPSHRAS